MTAYEAAYLEAKNALHAWRTANAARASGFAVPEWVLSYFDRVVIRLYFAAMQNHPDPAPAIAEAVGLKSERKSAPGRLRTIAQSPDTERHAGRRTGDR